MALWGTPESLMRGDMAPPSPVTNQLSKFQTETAGAVVSAVRARERADMELYKALPLRRGQTRLMRLTSSPPEAKLEGDLMVATISASGSAHLISTHEKVDFAALSYTWGTGPYCDMMMLNGYSKDIKENLADFLYQYRTMIAPGDYAYLWVDAVCINQQDDEEKADQVSNMRAFYSAAERVIVWLGRQGRYTAQAADFLRTTAKQFVTGSSQLGEKDVDALYGNGTIQGLVDIYSRPWSTRIWIKQEVWSAHYVTIWCGRHQWRPYVWLSVACSIFLAIEDDFLTKRMILLGLDRRNILSLVGLEWGVPMDESDTIGQRDRRNDPAKVDILNLLRGSLFSDSSDARDRIYALIGMSTMQPTDFQITYKMTAEEVYIGFARHIANREGCIGALLGLNVLFGPLGGLKLPSWVPDWRHLTDGGAKNDILKDATAVTGVASPIPLEWQDDKLILTGVTLTHTHDFSDIVMSTDVSPNPPNLCRMVACFGCGLPIILKAVNQMVSPSYTFVGLVPPQRPVNDGKAALSLTTRARADIPSSLKEGAVSNQLETFQVI